MPQIESVKIGKSNFTFINGMPMGWFVDNKPVFFSPQSELGDKKTRGGIAAVLSVNDVSLNHSISQLLGGLTECYIRRHVYSDNRAEGKITKCKITTESRAILQSKDWQYPWVIHYKIKTIFGENFLQTTIKTNRLDKANISPIINLSIYAYFTIGQDNFVTTLEKKGVIFGRENRFNIVDEKNYWIESIGGKMLLLTSGTETCYLHSNDFNRQNCIQSVLSKSRSCGGTNGSILTANKEIEIGVTIELLLKNNF